MLYVNRTLGYIESDIVMRVNMTHSMFLQQLIDNNLDRLKRKDNIGRELYFLVNSSSNDFIKSLYEYFNNNFDGVSVDYERSFNDSSILLTCKDFKVKFVKNNNLNESQVKSVILNLIDTEPQNRMSIIIGGVDFNIEVNEFIWGKFHEFNHSITVIIK